MQTVREVPGSARLPRERTLHGVLPGRQCSDSRPHLNGHGTRRSAAKQAVRSSSASLCPHQRGWHRETTGADCACPMAARIDRIMSRSPTGLV